MGKLTFFTENLFQNLFLNRITKVIHLTHFPTLITPFFVLKSDVFVMASHCVVYLLEFLLGGNIRPRPLVVNALSSSISL